MSRLIVLSNRVKRPDDKQAGGLAIAVANALRQQGGVWMGWDGKVIPDNACQETLTAHSNHITPIVPRQDSMSQLTIQTDAMQKPAPQETISQETVIQSTLHQETITYATTPFTQQQYQHFYCGFANSVLWPFLHNREDLILEKPKDLDIYQQVNAQFAQQLSQIAMPEDVIWVHDYHFFSVAHHCRQLGMTNRIGFFLHIPFAPPSCWQDCPHATILLKHLSTYDVIGLQTHADKRACQATLAPFITDKRVTIESYPIGVDAQNIEQQITANLPAWQSAPAKQNDLIKIIAVDRIDYSKGILQRLQVFFHFLTHYPQYHGKIQLQQIACPSRLDLPAYRDLYQAITEQVAKLQHEFATQEWQPLVYSESVLAHEALMQVFFNSQICWVNSLKDGMNLVAKEYIAAQNPANAGVLMLSKYAGASEQMPQALVIDPNDNQNVIESLLTAITMNVEEKNRRYQALLHGIQQQDLSQWQQRFLQDLYA